MRQSAALSTIVGAHAMRLPMRFMKSLPFFLCFFALSAAARATTYYVAPQGSDANDGLAAERPLKTAQKAADKTEPGDSVLFAGGTYQLTDGQQLLKVTRSGAPD